jgi:hypothetical protein
VSPPGWGRADCPRLGTAAVTGGVRGLCKPRWYSPHYGLSPRITRRHLVRTGNRDGRGRCLTALRDNQGVAPLAWHGMAGTRPVALRTPHPLVPILPWGDRRAGCRVGDAGGSQRTYRREQRGNLHTTPTGSRRKPCPDRVQLLGARSATRRPDDPRQAVLCAWASTCCAAGGVVAIIGACPLRSIRPLSTCVLLSRHWLRVPDRSEHDCKRQSHISGERSNARCGRPPSGIYGWVSGPAS